MKERNENLITEETQNNEVTVKEAGFSKVAIIVTIAGIVLVLAVIIIVIMVSTSNSSKNKTTATTVEEPNVSVETPITDVVVEEPEVIDETPVVTEEPEVVEEPVEVDTSNLSDEEWFKSLNLNTVKFLVFNSITGERAVLEDGQDYVVKEGDRIATWYPLDWKFKDLYPIGTDGVQFDCVFLNMNSLDESYEEKLIVIDTDGNEITVTLNLIVE